MSQIDLFDLLANATKEIEDDRRNAIEYASQSIFKSAGGRGKIKRCLDAGDHKGAYRAFSECFRTYGFSAVKGYAFNGHTGVGKLRGGDGITQYESTAKEMFDALVKTLDKAV